MPRNLPILLFDVNETLLSLSPFVPFFARVFGSAEALREWFNLTVVYSSTVTITSEYIDSAKISGAVLNMMAQARERVMRPEDLAEFKQIAASQPIYDDVLPALTSLKQAGFRLVTLSNNSTVATDQALKRNGILELFERTFSIDDEVHRYKPAPESYHAVATALGVQPEGLCLISCHAFDVFGATTAGLHTAMILRPANSPVDLGKFPEIIAKDLESCAREIIGSYLS